LVDQNFFRNLSPKVKAGENNAVATVAA